MEFYRVNVGAGAFVSRVTNKLHKVFPAGVPDFVMEQLRDEMYEISATGLAPMFQILTRLLEEAEKADECVGVVGDIRGVVAYSLISETEATRLYFGTRDSFYYCPICGQYEIIEDDSIDEDDPHWICCNHDMEYFSGWEAEDEDEDLSDDFWEKVQDGAYVPNLRISEGMIPVIRQVLEEAYPDHEIMPITDKDGCNKGGFAILPHGTTRSDIIVDNIFEEDDGNWFQVERHYLDCNDIPWIDFFESRTANQFAKIKKRMRKENCDE